jgi:hypothetical protein
MRMGDSTAKETTTTRAIRNATFSSRVTGGKVIRQGTRHVTNRLATALRLTATTLLRSQSYFGAQYRRLRGKLGARKVSTSMPHKLARFVYRLRKRTRLCRRGEHYWRSATSRTTGASAPAASREVGLQLVGPYVA